MKKRMLRGALIASVLAISVILSIVCFGTASLCCAESGSLVGTNPWPKEDKVSPGFGGYDQVTYKEGYTPHEITKEMNAWQIYQAMAENFRNVDHMTQVETTISDIKITLTTDAYFILRPGTNLGVKQVSSLITSSDGKGNSFSQAISQMDTLGDDLKALDGIAPSFGFWEKRKYVAEDKTTYVQKGQMGTRRYDEKELGGITCDWIQGVEEIKDSAKNFDDSTFDVTKRVASNTTTEDYKVEVGPAPYNIPSNTDNIGNKVIKVNFKTTDGGWSGDYMYVWDDVEGTAEGKYVWFVGDRNHKALPTRGDAISSCIINEETFDLEKSTITTEKINGRTLYTLNVALKPSEKYSWDLITSGEKRYLQNGTSGFVDFPMEYATFRNDMILRYEVWDNGSIRRIMRQYSMDLGDESGDARGVNKTSVLGGAGYGYGSVTNTQYQEFRYDETDDIDMGGGVLSIWTIVGIVAGVVAAVVIGAVVTVVILKKKELSRVRKLRKTNS